MIVFVGMAALFCFSGFISFAQAQDASAVAVKVDGPIGFGGVVAQGESATMTVEAIDKESRNVTMKDESGETSVIKCGPEVINFDQIAVGDTVKVDLSQVVSLIVSNDKTALARTESEEMQRAPLGDKPSGSITKKIEVVATVEDIDYVNRTVTLKGPQQTLTVKVDESAVNFDRVKKGDMVNLEVTQTLAIAVTK